MQEIKVRKSTQQNRFLIFQVFLRLNRPYYDDYYNLSITSAVALFPGRVLIVHGDADTHVPVRYGEKLYELYCTRPKGEQKLVVIRGGNHLLSSSKCMKQAMRALTDFLSST
eukprot:Colp12_sorted_trinity150504_noHs@10096